MTQNRRIVLNTIATYSRSMIGVLCGIFSARWVLEALGQIDYGLYAVVAGMAIFIGFLNIQFSSGRPRAAASFSEARLTETDIRSRDCTIAAPRPESGSLRT